MTDAHDPWIDDTPAVIIVEEARAGHPLEGTVLRLSAELSYGASRASQKGGDRAAELMADAFDASILGGEIHLRGEITPASTETIGMIPLRLMADIVSAWADGLTRPPESSESDTPDSSPPATPAGSPVDSLPPFAGTPSDRTSSGSAAAGA